MSKGSWEAKFSELTSKTHTEQGIWWLNGFWEDGAKQYAEDIWKCVHQFIECQIDGPVLYGSKKQDFKEGCDLDEFKAHRILEIMGETMTVVALRKRLSALDIDNNKRMAISEYLLDKYKKTPAQLVNSPQSDTDPAELKRCQDACEAAGAALDAASVALEACQKAEAEVKQAEAELQASLQEIATLEKAKQDKINACQKIIDDPATGAVKKGKAVQEKEQTLAEDPLPLRKAKITQAAALKRTEKARKVCEEETAKSAAAKKAAEAALKVAEEALQKMKSKGTGSPQGRLWWMERVLTEKKKFTKK